MKERHLDADIKPFFKFFKEFSYSVDYGKAYDDFLTIALTSFAFPDCPIGQDLHKMAIRSYDEKQKKMVSLMFNEMLLAYQKNLVNDFSWYDFFGDTYMELAGRYKSSAFGQFFTPPEICTLMVEISGSECKGKRINDCACGSGRLILAHHVKYPGNFYVAEDIDLICCKMTVLNFLLHGVRGEVICHDSLVDPEKFRYRFIVNPNLGLMGGVPHVIIEQNGTLPYLALERKSLEVPPVTNQFSQLTLF